MNKKTRVVLPVPFTESEHSNNQTIKTTMLNFKKSDKNPSNFFCSITLCTIFFFVLTLIIMGISIMVISITFDWLHSSKNIVLTQNNIELKITKDITEYVKKGQDAVSYIKRLLVLYRTGGDDDLNLIPSEHNDKVLVVDEDMNFFKTTIEYVKDNDFVNGRYTEIPTTRQISCSWYEEDQYVKYLSFNEDGSVYDYDSYTGYDFNASSHYFSEMLGKGRYDVTEKDYYIGVTSTNSDSLTTYFSAGINPRITYSSPVFYSNGSMKGFISINYDNKATRGYLKEYLPNDYTNLILMQRNGELISSTYDHVNNSKQYVTSRGKLEATKLNCKWNLTLHFKQIYEQYSPGKRCVIGKDYVYYVELEFANENNVWILVVLTNKLKIDKDFYISVVTQILFFLVILFISISLGTGFMIIILKKSFHPIAKLIEKIGTLDKKFVNPKNIAPELRNVVSNIKLLYNIMKHILEWLPSTVVNSIIASVPYKPTTDCYIIMFIDIKDFTKTSQLLEDSQDITDYLNKFFGKCRKLMTKSKIEVIAYIGDEIYCAIKISKDDNVNEFFIAMEFVTKVLNKCKKWSFSVKNNINNINHYNYGVTIGMAYGNCNRCVLGSSGKCVETIIGNPVNEASRMRGICTENRVNIIINSSLYEAIPQDIKIKYEIVLLRKDQKIKNIKGDHEIFTINLYKDQEQDQEQDLKKKKFLFNQSINQLVS